MRALLRTMWVSVMMLAGLVTLTSTVGATRPEKPLLGLFATDCPMPCWQGIRPGMTSIDEAISRLSLSPFVDTRTLSIVQPPGAGDTWHVTWWSDYDEWGRRAMNVQGTLFARYGVVEHVGVTFVDWPVTLGDVMGQIGTPPHLVVESRAAAPNIWQYGNVSVELYYPDMGLSVQGYQPTRAFPLWTTLGVARISVMVVDRHEDESEAPYWEFGGEWRGTAIRNYFPPKEGS